MHKIEKTKFGLKLWSINYALIEGSEKLIKDGIFDYVELMIVPDAEISYFEKIKIPYIIHTTSDRYGLNIADGEKNIINYNLIKQNIEWADKLNAEYLVLHPGFGSLKIAQNFLEKIKDNRILIENMPKVGINNEAMIGYDPEQIKKLMGDKFGFCLDFNHAVKAAASLKIDYKKFINDFLKLKPKMIHISDGILKDEKDDHLNIGEGDYDFSFFAECIGKNKVQYITLETPKADLNSLNQDYENIRKLKSIMFS